MTWPKPARRIVSAGSQHSNLTSTSWPDGRRPDAERVRRRPGAGPAAAPTRPATTTKRPSRQVAGRDAEAARGGVEVGRVERRLRVRLDDGQHVAACRAASVATRSASDGTGTRGSCSSVVEAAVRTAGPSPPSRRSAAPSVRVRRCARRGAGSRAACRAGRTTTRSRPRVLDVVVEAVVQLPVHVGAEDLAAAVHAGGQPVEEPASARGRRCGPSPGTCRRRARPGRRAARAPTTHAAAARRPADSQRPDDPAGPAAGGQRDHPVRPAGRRRACRRRCR